VPETAGADGVGAGCSSVVRRPGTAHYTTHRCWIVSRLLDNRSTSPSPPTSTYVTLRHVSSSARCRCWYYTTITSGQWSTLIQYDVTSLCVCIQIDNCANPVCITKDLSLVIHSRDTTMMAARYWSRDHITHYTATPTRQPHHHWWWQLTNHTLPITCQVNLDPWRNTQHVRSRQVDHAVASHA